MTPEAKQEFQRTLEHIKAVQALDDDTLLTALFRGYRNPNLDPGDAVTKAVLESRLLTRISDGTKELARINEDSKEEVRRLVKSSLVIEGLTKWLVGLTATLIVLTVALCVDVGYKFATEHFSVPPPPAAPQTPGPQPR